MGFRYRVVKYMHIFGLIFAIFLQIFGLPCPLTLLENFFRKKAGVETYEEGFISYYLEKILYVEIEPFIIFTLTIFLAVFNVYIYLRRRGYEGGFS